MDPKNRKIKIALIMGSTAFVIHGSVTYYINASHGFLPAIRAASTQGVICFLATLSSAWLMQFLFDFGTNSWQRYLYACAGAGSIMLSIMVTVHSLSHTPELTRTVTTAALIASPYYLLFPLFLLRQLQQEQPTAPSQPRFLAIPFSTREFLQVVKNNIFGPSSVNKQLVKNCPNPVVLRQIDPRLTIVFLGDLMPLHGKSVTFSPKFLDFFQNVNYLVVNLEGSLFQSEKKGLLAQLHQRETIELLSTLLPPDKIILSCANNHSADFGEENFIKTTDYLRDLGFSMIGGRTTPTITLHEEITITAATEWSNQQNDFLTTLEDISTTPVDDTFQILSPHWCYELELYPSSRQIDRARELLKTFDLIVGHHSHVPGIIATHNTDSGQKMVAYSLGDVTIAIGTGFKNYAWGQAMKVEFGPEKGAAPGTQWQQGKTEWIYTRVVKAADYSSSGRMSIIPETHCPWMDQ